MNHLCSTIALATATLGLSLAAAPTAHAQDSLSSAATARDVASSSSSPTAASAVTGRVRFTTSGLITDSKWSHAKTHADVSVRGGGKWFIVADVVVNGKVRARKELIASSISKSRSATWPRSAGTGKVQLRNIVVKSGETRKRLGRLPNSNAVAIRRMFDQRGSVRISRRGAKVTVRAVRWRYYQATGKLTAPRAVRVKRSCRGTWVPVKSIRLNKKGTGKARFPSARKSCTYYVHFPRTATIAGYYKYLPRT